MSIRGRFGVVLICLLLAGCNEELYRNLSARDANEIVALLRRHEIAATREIDGTTFKISVPKNDFARSVDLLSKAGLPKEQFRSIGEVFPGEGLIVSPFEQRARLVFAVSQELTRTIKAISGVTTARVHVVMPEMEMRGSTPSRASASVVVMYRPKTDITDMATKIRLIVANAVPELADKDVSVALFAAENEYDDLEAAGEAHATAKVTSGGSSVLTWLLWIAAMVALGIGLFTLWTRREVTP